MSMTYLLLALLYQEPGIRIVDPTQGAYLSGPYEVVLAKDPDLEPRRTTIYLDGEIAADQEGWVSGITIDFGEEIKAHRISAAITLADGTVLRAKAVVSRELVVNFEETTRVVLVSAVVKTRRGRLVSGLEAGHFTVFEDGHSLEIASFQSETLPLDMVFIVDTSSSLREDMPILKQSASAFVRGLSPADKALLMEIKTEPYTLTTFTTDRKQLLNRIAGFEPLGETALFDALLHGLEAIKGRKRGRRALVLFTDGRDSRYEEPEDKAERMRTAITLAQNHEIAVFTIGLGKRINQAVLERMADETGGRFYYAARIANLDLIFSQIIEDLKHQYVIGVKPLSNKKGYHRLRIEVDRRGVEVHARKGYAIE